MIFPKGKGVTHADGHALVAGSARAGERLTMLNASGWSHAGVDDARQWQRAVRERAEAMASPLKVTVRR